MFILGIDDFCIARNASINLGDFPFSKTREALFKTVPVAVNRGIGNGNWIFCAGAGFGLCAKTIWNQNI